MDRRSRRRFRLENLRRKYCRRHVLHLRHDRKSERRALFAPIERAARVDGEHFRHERLFVTRRGNAGRAHVPCQLLGHGVRRSDCRRVGVAVPIAGASLVMPGAKLDGASVFELLERYKVTCTAAVPTVWLMLLQHLEATGSKLPHLRKVVIGGSACPRAMAKTFQDVYGVEVIHAWGMTEMSPLGTACTLKPEYAALGGDARLDIQQKQGQTPFMVEMKITDDAGKRLPWDGKTFGRLRVRGPSVARAYYKEDDAILDQEGFFDTGDVSTIDRHGYMQVTDRAKDVIKSGGEWISSIDLENLAVGHPKVAEAAVVGVKHPKWDERPLLVIVLKKDQAASRDEILRFMQGKIASWWMPDEVVFVDEIPHTATGKILKTVLRERFKDFVLPSAVAAR